MTDFTSLRIGQVNGAGATDALFLKVWSGEVLVAFEEANVTMNRHMVRQIQNGKSAAFPATWKVTASYHTPGTTIVGQASNVNERVISIDDLLISPVFIPLIDEAKNHFDYRSVYSTETGNALAKQMDTNVLQTMVLAARASATITGANGGTQLTNAAFATSGSALASGLFSAAQTLDEKDVPGMERAAFFKPAQYYLLVQNLNAINKDWGGQGSYSDGKIVKIADVEIVKANHLPSTNVNTGPSAYQGDFTNTRGVVSHKSAVGTVKLLDLATEMEYQIREQGTLIVSKYAVGHGILRPESAVELKIA